MQTNTSAPINADAATGTTKVLGVSKTFTVKKTTKVTGLSKAEKKIVKVTVNKKKKTVTVKGLKAGKVTCKIGSKNYTIKVGATKIEKKSFKTSVTAGKSISVSAKATAGKGDKYTWKSSKKSVATVDTKKTGLTNTVKGVAAGTTTITVTSKNTGKKLSVKVTVKAAATETPVVTVTPEVTTTPEATTGSATTAPDVTATPDATTGSATTTPEVTATPDVSTGSATTAPDVTATPEVTTAPAATATATPSATPAAVSATAISGSAVGASKLKVTFDQPVTTGSAVFTVKVGNVDKTVSSVAWLDTKTAVLTMNEKLQDATYAVSVKEGTGDALATSVIAKAEKATVVKLETTKVAMSSNVGIVGVSVRNQYDEKMTVADDSIVATAYNKTQGVDDQIDTDYKYATGLKLTGSQTKVGDKLLLTLTYGNLAVVSGEVEVVVGKTAASVSFGAYEKTANTQEVHLENGDTFKLPIKIKDQYDEDMPLKADSNWANASGSDDIGNDDQVAATKVVLDNGTIITSSDADVIDLTAVTVDSEGNVVFTAGYAGTDGSKDAKTATINVLAPSTGKSVSYTVNTYAARKIAAITGFSNKGTNKLAAEKTLTENEQIALNYDDFTYADQFGDVRSASKASSDSTEISVKDAKATGTDPNAEKPASDKDGAMFMAATTFAEKTFGSNTPAIMNTLQTFTGSNVFLYAGHEGTEEVTFTLGDSKLSTKFTVNAAVASVVATKDKKTSYTAGEEVEVTLTAKKDDESTNASYNNTSVIKFTVKKDSDDTCTKTYNKSVTFVKGVATVKLPVTLVGQDKITISNIAGKAVSAIESGIEVKAAAFSKYEIAAVDTNATDIDLKAVDKFGNTVETKEVANTLVKVTATNKNGAAKALTGTNIDSDGFVAATDNKNGTVTIIGAIKKGDVIAEDIVTVTIDNVNYSVSVVAAD